MSAPSIGCGLTFARPVDVGAVGTMSSLRPEGAPVAARHGVIRPVVIQGALGEGKYHVPGATSASV